MQTPAKFDPDSTHPVIDLMESQQGISKKGGTMRLGAYPCKIRPNTIMATAYGEEMISERHRHRYEFNNNFREEIENKGMQITGTSPTGELVETVEIPNHPFYIGVQFHPEFKSRPNRAHPLFKAFVAASLKKEPEQQCRLTRTTTISSRAICSPPSHAKVREYSKHIRRLISSVWASAT